MTGATSGNNASPEQPFDQACESFVRWLDNRILVTGRGDEIDLLDVEPASTFWLGRLAAEEEVQLNPIGERAERLDPCAIGIRLRPAGPPPWTLTATVTMRAWVKEDKDTARDPARPWRKLNGIVVPVTLTITDGDTVVGSGRQQIAGLLTQCGAAGLSAEVRVEVEDWHAQTELVIQLVNTSPAVHGTLKDTHLYETNLEVAGLPTRPFVLESLPDSFRYDRSIPAYGINAGVDTRPGPDGSIAFSTTDVVVAETRRPEYWNSPLPRPDLRFERMAGDPIGPITQLLEALSAYNDKHWSVAALDARQATQAWDYAIRQRADAAARDVTAELARMRHGLELLTADPVLRRAFSLMNRAILHTARNRGFDSWRPFQIGFLLQSLPFLADPAHEADIVDTVWFATGGGKTETYLGLLVTAAMHDRLTGKTTGVTAWSRFPLRMLSLQQTQRFADALAGAELVRRAEGIKGASFSLGFYVGSAGTPNRIPVEAKDGIDPDDESMPGRYQVLLTCPFCQRAGITMRLDRRLWRLAHECPHQDCPWPDRALPVYVVDDEIYRFLPTVVIGTLDKAANIGMQAAMRGLVGPPLGLCDQPGHGYCYAPRKSFPHGCLVPECPGARRSLPMAAARYAPSLRLQDELHLLRDSLGAVDSHYESILDDLQRELGASRGKIAASSATLTGYDRQVSVLYRRQARVFPQPGPRAGESFWTRPSQAVLRRFVAVAPRGVTLEFVSDRTTNILQEHVRLLLDQDHRDTLLTSIGVDPAHADPLLSLYGTDVIYGSTLYDVEAAQRSLDSNATVPINSEQLTGQTAFDDVREILGRLEHPEPDFDDRIHVIAASSMLSHGVDISRLNLMTMLGLPLTTAEFIQTTARVGRDYPGLVHVLHKIARERDAETFRHFRSFVLQGDRFIEPIPITRRSRRVLSLTMPGVVEARRLMLMEPGAAGQRLTTLDRLRAYVTDTGLTPAGESEAITAMLGFTGDTDELLREEIRRWLATWFANLEDPATSVTWPNQLGPTTPMISLRDVEASAPIHD
jgi:hypothetical protein